MPARRSSLSHGSSPSKTTFTSTSCSLLQNTNGINFPLLWSLCSNWCGTHLIRLLRGIAVETSQTSLFSRLDRINPE
jgi:hypothetical protein